MRHGERTAGETHLIVGIGDVGTALGRLLVSAGHRVVGLRRDATRIPAPIEALAGDVAEPAGIPPLPVDVDVVHYLVSAGGRDPDLYRSAYVTGVANTLAALSAAGATPRRFVFVSSTAVYGQTDGGFVDESSPTEPADHRGEALLEGERLVAESSASSCSVRFAGIYGPGRYRLIHSLVEGRAACRPDPPEWTNRIHRDDCAGLLAHVADLDETPAVLVGVDDEPAPRCEVLDWLAAEIGAAPPTRRSDATVGRANKRCDNTLLHGIDYQLIHPTYREGFVGVIEDWRRNGTR